MFTVIAIFLTIIGLFLFTRPHTPRTNDIREPGFSRTNNVGGVILIIASMCWFFVLFALFVQLIGWLWNNAP